VLAQWITHLTATGHPARHAFIKEIAEEIRRQRHIQSAIPVSYPNVGNTWVPQFLSRHPTLQTTLAYTIELAQIKEVSLEAIVNFFEVFSALFEEHQIPLEYIYNMDETGTPTFLFHLTIGFLVGESQTSYVVVDSTVTVQTWLRVESSRVSGQLGLDSTR